jgi:hypothetical protein
MPNAIAIGIGSSMGGGKSAFVPSQIAGLIAWYDATSNVYNAGTTPATNGQTVSQWTDKSGNGHHLIGTSTTKPVFNTNVQNGLPAVISDGISQFMQGTFTFNDPQHIFIAFNPVSLSGGGAATFDGITGDQMLLYNPVANLLRMYGFQAGSDLTSLTQNTFMITDHLYHTGSNLVDNSSPSESRLNNGTKVGGDVGNDSGGGFTIGSNANQTPSNRNSNTKYCEIVLYNVALSNANSSLVNPA